MRSLYGTRQHTDNAVFYQNHELILSFENSGKVALQGHGAHSQGSYSIIFNNINSLKQFINRKKNDFSTSQQEWLAWAIENQAVQ
jgi:hypothetical protein